MKYLTCPDGMLKIKCILFVFFNQAEIQSSQSHITISPRRVFKSAWSMIVSTPATKHLLEAPCSCVYKNNSQEWRYFFTKLQDDNEMLELTANNLS